MDWGNNNIGLVNQNLNSSSLRFVLSPGAGAAQQSPHSPGTLQQAVSSFPHPLLPGTESASKDHENERA